MKNPRIPPGLSIATAIILAMSLGTSAIAADFAPDSSNLRIVCPLHLPAGAINKGQRPDDWTVSAESWRLDGGGLLHGSPAEESILRPDLAEVKKRGAREVAYRRWELSVPHPHET